MAQKEMYRGKAFSPFTTLKNNIGSADVVIEVTDASVLPEAPNFITISSSDEGETIKYIAKAGNVLNGCIRGIEGTARAWNKDDMVARNFTAVDLDTLQDNVRDLVTSVDSKVAKADIANTLDIDAAGKVLDARQGKIINAAVSKKINSADAVALTEYQKHITNQNAEKHVTGDKETKIQQITGKNLLSNSDFQAWNRLHLNPYTPAFICEDWTLGWYNIGTDYGYGRLENPGVAWKKALYLVAGKIVSGSPYADLIQKINQEFRQGEIYTLSFEFIDNASPQRVIELRAYYNGSYHNMQSVKTEVIAGALKRISGNVIISANVADFLTVHIRFVMDTLSEIYMSNFKFEKGSIATTYVSPTPQENNLQCTWNYQEILRGGQNFVYSSFVFRESEKALYFSVPVNIMRSTPILQIKKNTNVGRILLYENNAYIGGVVIPLESEFLVLGLDANFTMIQLKFPQTMDISGFKNRIVALNLQFSDSRFFLDCAN